MILGLFFDNFIHVYNVINQVHPHSYSHSSQTHVPLFLSSSFFFIRNSLDLIGAAWRNVGRLGLGLHWFCECNCGPVMSIVSRHSSPSPSLGRVDTGLPSQLLSVLWSLWVYSLTAGHYEKDSLAKVKSNTYRYKSQYLEGSLPPCPFSKIIVLPSCSRTYEFCSHDLFDKIYSTGREFLLVEKVSEPTRGWLVIPMLFMPLLQWALLAWQAGNCSMQGLPLLEIHFSPTDVCIYFLALWKKFAGQLRPAFPVSCSKMCCLQQ